MDGQVKTENINNTRNATLMDLVGQIQNGNTKSYIAGRIIPRMEWYSAKGGECKKSIIA